MELEKMIISFFHSPLFYLFISVIQAREKPDNFARTF